MANSKLTALGDKLLDEIEGLDLCPDNKRAPAPTSFRIYPEDRGRLKKLVDNVNKVAEAKINRAHVIRALIFLGCYTSSDKILQAYKETV